MNNLSTEYCGIEIKNPVIAGASPLTGDMDSLKKLEENGVSAIVIKSLFEEEIRLEQLKLEEVKDSLKDIHAEMQNIFPTLEHSGPDEYLFWVRKAKESLSIPVIASLNAVDPATWLEYAKKIQQTGADGIELNFYSVPVDAEQEGSTIENEIISIVRKIVSSLAIPVSVKLSPFFANPLNVIKELDKAGVKSFVLFNRFFQPDIDVNLEKHTFFWHLTEQKDKGIALRYVGLLYGKIKANICANSGVQQAEDVIKLLLAGADCVQIVSAIFKYSFKQIQTILKDMQIWMQDKGYNNINDFKGKLSQKNSRDPWQYTRAQYVRPLLDPEEFVSQYRII